MYSTNYVVRDRIVCLAQPNQKAKKIRIKQIRREQYYHTMYNHHEMVEKYCIRRTKLRTHYACKQKPRKDIEKC